MTINERLEMIANELLYFVRLNKSFGLIANREDVDGRVLKQTFPIGDFYSFVIYAKDGRRFRVKVEEDK
jgi:hypothetical protein